MSRQNKAAQNLCATSITSENEMQKKDELGSRMKIYEAASTSRVAFKGQPLLARLDGRAFHTFTKGLNRPYDVRLSTLMQETMVSLVDRFNAKVGYTQSDEISLMWYEASDSVAEYPFGGRFQKLDSLLASYCTAFFNSKLTEHLPQKLGRLPTFDCRSWVVPNLLEGYHAFLWRQQDATKNAISMAAQSQFAHSVLHHKSGREMVEMLRGKGTEFEEYPSFFKRGSFARRVREERLLTDEQLSKIPTQYRPTGPILRSFVDVVDIWLAKQTDPVGVLVNGVEIVQA